MSTFVKVPDWILGLNLKPEALGVYCQLRSYLNRKTGRCNPSVTTMASAFGTSHDYIQKRLAELEEVGAVLVLRFLGRANAYRFPDEPRAVKRVPDDPNNSTNHTPNHTPWSVSNQMNQNAVASVSSPLLICHQKLAQEYPRRRPKRRRRMGTAESACKFESRSGGSPWPPHGSTII